MVYATRSSGTRCKFRADSSSSSSSDDESTRPAKLTKTEKVEDRSEVSKVTTQVTVETPAVNSEGQLKTTVPTSKSTIPSTQINNWQVSTPTLNSKLSYLLFNEVLSDVRFLVGKGTLHQEIPAHRFVLIMSSPVFEQMFNGSSPIKGDKIEHSECEPEAFRCFLRFIYTDKMNIEPNTAINTLHLAKRYEITPLEQHCVDYLIKIITTKNAFSFLIQGQPLGETRLVQHCLQMIDKNPALAFLTKDFLDISLDVLCQVLKRNTLGAPEIVIFRAMKRWAEAYCDRQQIVIITPEKLRKVLGRAIFLIRYPLMSVEEFSVVVVASGLLNDEETLQLFKYLTGSPDSPLGSFSSEPRKPDKYHRSIQTHENSECREELFKNGNVKKFVFEVCFYTNQRLFLDGLGIFRSEEPGATHEVVITVKSASGKVLGECKRTYTSPKDAKTNRIQRVDLTNSVEIKADNLYHIEGSVYLCGSNYSYKNLTMLSEAKYLIPGNGNVTFRFMPATSCLSADRAPNVIQGLVVRVYFHL